jgi:hypothetical protein
MSGQPPAPPVPPAANYAVQPAASPVAPPPAGAPAAAQGTGTSMSNQNLNQIVSGLEGLHTQPFSLISLLPHGPLQTAPSPMPSPHTPLLRPVTRMQCHISLLLHSIHLSFFWCYISLHSYRFSLPNPRSSPIVLPASTYQYSSSITASRHHEESQFTICEHGDANG